MCIVFPSRNSQFYFNLLETLSVCKTHSAKLMYVFIKEFKHIWCPVGRLLDGSLSITDGTKILRMTLIHPNLFKTNRIWSDTWEFGDLDSIYLTWSCVLLSQVENPL